MAGDAVKVQAIYLLPPHGEAIWRGDKTLVVKAVRFDLAGKSYHLASGGLVYGTVMFGEPTRITLADFARLQPKHMITPEERAKWWPDVKALFAWPVAMVESFEPPKPYDSPAGGSSFIADVEYINGDPEALALRPTAHDDGLARGPALSVASVDLGDGPVTKGVSSLLDGFHRALYAGEHHDGTGPVGLAKADAGDTVEPSSVPADDTMWAAFTTAGAVQPPLPPDFFMEVLRQSNILRQDIDILATNVDGFGHHFEPVLDLDSDDAWRLVAAKLRSESEGKLEGELADGVIEERLERYKAEAVAELSKLEAFFEWAGLGTSFVQLRKATRFDWELIGFGGWEVLRTASGEIAKFVRVPAYTLRLLPADPDPIQIEEVQRAGAPWESRTVPIYRNFRRFVHYQGGGRRWGACVYFRDFLDPRIVSRKTGQYFENMEALIAVEGPSARAANELIYFADAILDSPYGEPRWIGNLLSVLGSRAAEEVNFLFFQNKSIPPMVITIAGGAVKPEDVETIKTRIRDELQGGPEKFHKVLIITANTDPVFGTQPSIEFKPLTDALLKDALFASYDSANRQKVSESFRLPPLLRGDTKDFNRATAMAAMQFAETQVFQGLRSDFDWLINNLIMSALGARYWKFASNPPPLRDPEAVVDMVTRLSQQAVITPAEARRELARVGFDLDHIEEPWTKRPIAVTSMGIGFEPDEGERVKVPVDSSVHQPDGEEPMVEAEAVAMLERIMGDAVRDGRVSQRDLQRMNLSALRRRLANPPDDSDPDDVE